MKDQPSKDFGNVAGYHIPNLVVGRDRAHVRTLLEEFPCTEVVSASEFFDKIRSLSFFCDEKLVRDDRAPMIFAQRVLAQTKNYPVKFAKKFASLYSACYHGTSSPKEILDKIRGLGFEFESVFEALAHIDQAMQDVSLVNGVSALYHAWHLIKTDKILPGPFLKRPVVFLRHLIDLTSLEIEVIKDLSRCGVKFHIVFPLDFQNRGINAAVDFSAKLFEKSLDLNNIDLYFDNIAQEGPLLSLVENLFKENCTVSVAAETCSVSSPANIIHEANNIAARAAQISMASRHDSIAVAVRSIDGRAKIYQRALEKIGLNVKDRKGISLLKTGAFSLLSTIFSAKRSSLQKSDLIGLISHPLFLWHVADEQQKSHFLRLIERLGIDDRLHSSTFDRYHMQMKKFRNTIERDEEEKKNLDGLEVWLKKIEDLLQLIKIKDRFENYLTAIAAIIEQSFVENDSIVSSLKMAISSLKTSSAYGETDPALNFSEFISLLEEELSSITIPNSDNEEIDGVEFLLLPELLGRRFDHVFIADISFGRMPQNSEPDPLLDDKQRILLNSVFKKPLLRVFFDDPFEPLPVPPRQALEPFWFASAVASAKKSIHFSCAERDDGDVEQAPSEFFMWLREHVKCFENSSALPNPLLSSHDYLRFLQGVERSETSVFSEANLARKNAFQEDVASPFAFAFPHHLIQEAFVGKLSENPKKPLTPTMVENFAECRFKGFCERVLMIDTSIDESDDLDVRVLGQIIHRALELYFSKSQTASTKVSRDQITKVLALVVNEFSSKHFIQNKELLACHMAWVTDALVGLLTKMSEVLGDGLQHPMAQELAFGLPKSLWPPVSIEVNKRKYLLGGRIDRLDRHNNGFLIIDYKLSSIATLKSELASKNILTRHFQMPIYLRLVADHIAADDPSKVSFAFASIRDGELLPAVAREHEIVKRIFDDHGDDGLGQAIDRIFAPIMRGEIVATPGDHCTSCNFNFLCRQSESKRHA